VGVQLRVVPHGQVSSAFSGRCSLLLSAPNTLNGKSGEAAASRQPGVRAGEAAELWHVAGWRRMKK